MASPRQPNPSRKRGRPLGPLFLASAEAAEEKFLSTRSRKELEELTFLLALHLMQQCAFVLRQVPGAKEAAEQLKHAANLYDGLVERLRESEEERFPDWLDEVFRRGSKQLRTVWFTIVPERNLGKERGGAQPLGARAGVRTRLFYALLEYPDLFNTITATEMMCLALLTGLRTDRPTTDREEYRRRLDDWRKVIAACRGNIGGSRDA